MWKTFCHKFQPVKTQANSLGDESRERKVLQHLSQNVRECSRSKHAHAHPHQQSQMQCLSQIFLPSMATTGSHEVSHWRETLWMRSLWQKVCRQIQLESPHEDPQVQTLTIQIIPYIIPVNQRHYM